MLAVELMHTNMPFFIKKNVNQMHWIFGRLNGTVTTTKCLDYSIFFAEHELWGSDRL